MSVFSSPRFLRNVLIADALSCIATGGLQLLLTAQLAQVVNLPAALLRGTGWFLLAYAAVVALIAARDPLPRTLVGLLAAGNIGWAVGCVAVLTVGWVTPTAMGVAWVLAQAGTVALLAELQWTGLRRTRVVGWA